MNPYWSWVLTAVGLLGLYLAGRRIWWAWLIGLGAQGLWIAYAVATGQYGFVVSAVGYGAVYATNARRWYVERRRIEDPSYESLKRALSSTRKGSE